MRDNEVEGFKARAGYATQMEMGSTLRLLQELRQLWRFRSKEVGEKFDRTLPLADYVVDRWEKAKALGFGDGTSIYDSSLVIGDVEVGDQTWIGPSTVLDGSGGLKIGSFCSIAAGAQIYTHDTVKWAVTGGEVEAERSPTFIGDRCYIGPGAIVAKGVTIGNGCIIGAQSLVTEDIPDGMKAVGTPAKVIGPVDP